MQRIRKFIETSSPQKIFLCLAIPAIFLFIIVIPALQGWDEATHFLRAYQVSTGDFVSERFGKRAGGPIPINVSNMNDAALTDLIRSAQSGLREKAHIGYYRVYLKENHPDKSIVNKYFAGSAVYSPVSYAPQSLGIFLARTFRLPLLAYIYAGRFLNAIAFIVMAFFAIRITPRGKWGLTAIAVLPTTLTAAASLSPDAILNGAALIIVAVFLRGLFGKHNLSPKLLAALAAAIVVVSLTKQTYFILALLPLCLPPKKVFGSVKKYALLNAVFIGLALALTFAWYSRVGDLARYGYLDSRPNLNVNSVAQENYILHSPIHYAGTLIWEVFGHFNHQYLQLTGVLTWKGIVMPYYMILLIYIGLIMAFLISRYESSGTPALAKREIRLASYGPIIIGALSIILIYTGLYMYFSTVKETQIEGVQGRYFIPIIGLLLPAIMLLGRKRSRLFNFEGDKPVIALVSILTIQTIAAIFVITATNYIPNLQFV